MTWKNLYMLLLHIYHIYLSHSNIDISKPVAPIWVTLFICSYCGCNVIRGSSYRNLRKLLTLLKGQNGHDNLNIFFNGWYYMALWRYKISLQRVANLAKLPWFTEREHSSNLILKHYLFESSAFFPLVFFAEVSFCSEIPRCRELDESLSTHHRQP